LPQNPALAGGESVPGVAKSFDYDGRPLIFLIAVAAPPPHSTPHEADRRIATPLEAVFRRMAGEPPPVAEPDPLLLGFAEPVVEPPPIDGFLPIEAEPVRPSPPEPAPSAAPEPALSDPAPPRPQNLVGRLGKRLGDPSNGPAGDRHGRPSPSSNRRAYRRATLPAEIEIGDVPCTLIDVSIGGFAASGVPPIEPNALMPVTIRLLIDGIEVGTQLSARIVYVTQGRSSGRFIDLSPSQMAFLRYIVTWRGESVGAVGTTTLLDAIAGSAERGFVRGSVGRNDREAKSHWWAGLIRSIRRG
jgi:hypothetical protein